MVISAELLKCYQHVCENMLFVLLHACVFECNEALELNHMSNMTGNTQRLLLSETKIKFYELSLSWLGQQI